MAQIIMMLKIGLLAGTDNQDFFFSLNNTFSCGKSHINYLVQIS